jgi:hypothetical protein
MNTAPVSRCSLAHVASRASMLGSHITTRPVGGGSRGAAGNVCCATGGRSEGGWVPDQHLGGSSSGDWCESWQTTGGALPTVPPPTSVPLYRVDLAAGRVARHHDVGGHATHLRAQAPRGIVHHITARDDEWQHVRAKEWTCNPTDPDRAVADYRSCYTEQLDFACQWKRCRKGRPSTCHRPSDQASPWQQARARLHGCLSCA